MPKTTVYIALTIGAQRPAYPAYVVFRAPYRFVSGKVTVLPEPDPIALAEDGTGAVSIDPGVWIVDEVLPTQVLRRAVVVPESTSVVQYSDLVEVVNPIEIGFGPSWAHTAAAAAAESTRLMAEVAIAVDKIKTATSANDGVIAAVLADSKTTSRKVMVTAIKAEIDALPVSGGAPVIRPVMAAGSTATVGTSAGSIAAALAEALLALTGIRPTVAKAAGVGYTTAQMLTDFPKWLTANGPGVIIIETPEADARITTAITPAQTQANLRKMVGQALQAGIQPILTTRWRLDSAAANSAVVYNPPIYDSTTDAEVIASNDLARALANDMKVPIVDLQAILDGTQNYLATNKVDLNAYGYSIVAAALAATITHNPIAATPSNPSPGGSGGFDNGFDTGY